MIADMIDARLLSSADLVRAGAVLADVGTDHGYLPIFLLKRGRIERAVLSDINEGPLAKARENVSASSLSEKCEIILCDGAAALAGKGITDYAVCGMGGELIAEIISSAPQMKERGIRLILQPMSRHAHLRRYLCSHGFTILTERYSTSAGKHYVTILAEYTGDCRELDAVSAELGDAREHKDDAASYGSFLKQKKQSLTRVAEGKRLGGQSAIEEELLLSALNERLKDMGDTPDDSSADIR